MKRFCFRFDVDTHLCISKGMPNLLRLADELDVRFTFFVNMGRAISRLDYLRNRTTHGHGGTTAKLSTLKKLGVSGFLTAAILNPRVGAPHLDTIRAAHAAGHEIGLHGGSNHATWQNHGAHWPTSRIRREITLALDILRQSGIPMPCGFASPGWQGSDNLHEALQALGFRYVADIHDPAAREVAPVRPDLRLLAVPTNLCGEPDGVGYLEHMRAEGLDDVQALDTFAEQLAGRRLAVAYDHPYYAGVAELELIRRMIHVARDRGYEITTIENIIQKAEVCS